MLYDLPTFLRRTDRLAGVHHGIVVNNRDTTQRGYVQVKIPGLIDGGDGLLPWCAPIYEASLGGASGSQNFAVPDVGSVIAIEFDGGNVYCPYYVGWTPSLITDPKAQRALLGSKGMSADELLADYPNSYGRLDATGTGHIVNRAQKTAKWQHLSGITFLADGDGNLTVDIPKDLILNVGEDATLNIKELFDLMARNIKTDAKEQHNSESEMMSLKSKSATNIESGGAVSVDGKPINLN